VFPLKRVLITGSEGFIGKALCKQLSLMDEEYETFTMDKFGGGVNHICADITQEGFATIVQEINPDVVVHLAGNVSVNHSLRFPMDDFCVNAKGTLLLLLALEPTDCSNFVFVTSGGAIYDSNGPIPSNELSTIKPISPYGLSKYFAEGYVRVLSELKKSAWSSLALSNVYGSVKDQKQGVIFRFWDDITHGIDPTVFGNDAARDFIYIDDVVKALIMVIKKPVNTRINISSNSSTKLVDLLITIQEIMKTDLKPKILELPQAEVVVSQLDNSKARRLLGWEPSTKFDIGLKKSLGY
jgi:UDP-glucose 4-epimerase